MVFLFLSWLILLLVVLTIKNNKVLWNTKIYQRKIKDLHFRWDFLNMRPVVFFSHLRISTNHWTGGKTWLKKTLRAAPPNLAKHFKNGRRLTSDMDAHTDVLFRLTATQKPRKSLRSFLESRQVYIWNLMQFFAVSFDFKAEFFWAEVHWLLENATFVFFVFLRC